MVITICKSKMYDQVAGKGWKREIEVKDLGFLHYT